MYVPLFASRSRVTIFCFSEQGRQHPVPRVFVEVEVDVGDGLRHPVTQANEVVPAPDAGGQEAGCASAQGSPGQGWKQAAA